MLIPGDLYGIDKDSCHLSGIGLTPDASMFEVPPHRDQLFVGVPDQRPSQPGKLMGIFPARWHGPNSLFPYGYPMHARCWHLIEKLLGPDAAKDLESVVHALQNLSNDSCFQTYGHPHITTQDVEPWTHQSMGFYDPVKIPALRSVIDESIKRRHAEYLTSNPGNSDAGIFQNVRRTPGRHNLPLDIQWMILDLLEYNDIPSLLRALGWVLPDVYWERRLPKNLIFELEDLKKDESEFDWQFLCLGVEKLLRTSPELLNRQRLFPILAKMSELFHVEAARKENHDVVVGD
ncbi:hypothetical protein FQN54_001416 [Arachnomyces sp. PD_36]|nr:hypothetical protein FQN54_001416 [Arachnomyces sp. PD_36]